MKSPRPGLRELHVEHTKNLILEAFAKCLESSSHSDISTSEIASAAGVSDRTIYRHFPTRFDLLAGLADWTRKNVLPLIDLPSLRDLPAVFTEAMTHLDTRPRLARALVLTNVGRELDRDLVIDIQDMLASRIDDMAPHLTATDRRRAIAALSYLDSSFAWVKLHDDFAMNGEEMGAVVGWVMSLVIDAISSPED